MSFPIVFQKTTSEPNRIGKTITDFLTLEGVLKDETSVLEPVILIDLGTDVTEKNFFQCNYATITRFNRQYFITDMRSVRNNIVEVSMRVDVLDTYATEIKALTAIIRRQEKRWNLYLDDGVFSCYQNPNIVTKEFPSGFTGESIILAVAGS